MRDSCLGMRVKDCPAGACTGHLRIKTEWNGTEGARLLREMRVYVRPRRLKAEEAHGPPAERERLQ